jgi:DNA primase
MNLINLLIQNGHLLKQKTATEYGGPCIFCGGEDRFIVQTNKGNSGRYWCRQCKKSGDAIQYFRDFKKMSYHAACRELGIESENQTNSSPAHKIKAPPQTKQTNSVGELWKAKADEFVKRCMNNLNGNYLLGDGFKDWKEESEAALNWLRNKRGLSDQTIAKFGLGWNPRDYFLDLESWGLPNELNEQTGRPRTLWLPKGLVIPMSENGKIVQIKIRRFDLESSNFKERFVEVKGSAGRQMVFGSDQKSLVVVESELDAILITQEAGDIVTAISLGGAQKRPGLEVQRILESADIILVALDNDEAGIQESQEWWLVNYEQAKRWKCIEGKDPTEMHMNPNGLKVRLWIEAGLPQNVSGENSRSTKNDDPESNATPSYKSASFSTSTENCTIERKMFSSLFGREVDIKFTNDKSNGVQVNIDGVPYSQAELEKLAAKKVSAGEIGAIHKVKLIFEGVSF